MLQSTHCLHHKFSRKPRTPDEPACLRRGAHGKLLQARCLLTSSAAKALRLGGQDVYLEAHWRGHVKQLASFVCSTQCSRCPNGTCWYIASTLASALLHSMTDIGTCTPTSAVCKKVSKEPVSADTGLFTVNGAMLCHPSPPALRCCVQLRRDAT